MTEIWGLAALWLGLALAATWLAVQWRITAALAEIIVGVVAGYMLSSAFGQPVLQADAPWVNTLAGTGAILLTFLAGAELDPRVLKARWREAATIGVVSFLVPFAACAAAAHLFFGWGIAASLLAGVALAATSVAVCYTVMLESGLNVTGFGKILLTACFINDLCTVLALGFIFAPFGGKTFLLFSVLGLVLYAVRQNMPSLLRWFDNRPSEPETKFLLMCLFGLGALATWAGSEAVLPAYLLGMVLAGSVGADAVLIRRLRTLTIGFLTPFYFIRAGSFVNVPALAAAPICSLGLLAVLLGSKVFAVYRTTERLAYPRTEGIYTSLLMSTGLTFNTIAALYGLNHQIIDQTQYTYLVAAIILSAIVPALIANAYFFPRHLLDRPEDNAAGGAVAAPASPVAEP